MSAEQRLQHLKSAMRRTGVDTLIALATGYHNFLDVNAVLIASGYKSMCDVAAVLRSDGDDTLLVQPSWDVERATRSSVIADVRPTSDLPGSLAQAIHAEVLAGRRIGIAGLQRMPAALADRILSMLPAGHIDCDEIVSRAGGLKTEERLAAATRAVQIAEQGYDYLLRIAAPGMKESELAAQVYTYIKGLGADDNFMLLTSAQHGHGITTASERVIDEGDVVVIEITPSVNGQFVQLPRTAYVGDPPEALRKDVALLLDVFHAGLDAARCGSPVSRIATAMDEVMARHGYADYCRPPYMRVRGHGMGNVSNAPGDITVDNHTILEEGMVFVIHPEQYLPRSGYLLIGEPVVMDFHGATVLTSRPCTLDLFTRSTK